MWVGVENEPEIVAQYMTEPASETRRLLKIKLGKGLKRIWHYEPFALPEIYDKTPLLKGTSLEPGSELHVYPVTASDQSFLRAASICGYGPFLRPGFSHSAVIEDTTVRRVIGLDLEQTTYLQDGGFPLPTDPLISAAIVTWDNRYFCRTCCGTFDSSSFPSVRGYDVARVGSSEEIVEWVLDWIQTEEPDYVAIHFGYKFDVSRLCAHGDLSMSSFFARKNLGAKGTGLNLAVDGCTMIDTHWFIDKVHRSDYDSMALDEIAIKHGMQGKAEAPTMSVDPADEQADLTDMIFYNIVDAYLHKEILLRPGYLDEIINLATSSRCPISDSCRYITGTMVSTLLSSMALEHNRVLDWSSDGNQDLHIEGARVFDPVRGYHSDVAIMDFASMYPSMMINANISVETVFDVTEDYFSRTPDQAFSQIAAGVPIRTEPAADCVDWNSRYSFLSVGDKVACIDRSTVGFTPQVLQHLIQKRKQVGKATKQGWAMKVLANSMYGANSAPTSGLFSYLAGSSVTLSGRWCITVVEAISYLCGFRVVYGDTDSVFVSKFKPSAMTPFSLIDVIHRVFSFTPYSEVRLEAEKRVAHMILIGKKMYFGKSVNPTDTLLPDGRVVSRVDYNTDVSLMPDSDFTDFAKGIAMRRKDRPPVLRHAVEFTCQTVIRHCGSSDCVRELGEFYAGEQDRLLSCDFNPKHGMYERRKGGVSYLEFSNESGDLVRIKPENYDPAQHVPCPQRLMRSIRNNCDKILEACNLPGVDECIKRYIKGASFGSAVSSIFSDALVSSRDSSYGVNAGFGVGL